MPSVARIPVPTDNYDTPHSTIAAVTSLRAMAVAVDAAMDSLLLSVQRQSAAVEEVSDRAGRYQSRLAKLRCGDGEVGEGGGCCSEDAEGGGSRAPPLHISLPTSYDETSGLAQQVNRQRRRASAVAAVRDATHRAVRAVLRADRDLDDGGAVPSDAWLDRPTAFDESAECASAVGSMSVPSLRSQVLLFGDEVAYYEDATAASAAGSASAAEATARSSTGASFCLDVDDADDDASVRTGLTALSLTSRVAASDGPGGSATERRRQRQQLQMEKKRRERRLRQQQQQQSASEERTTTGAAATIEDIFDRASASRQQVLSGSRAYLCDVLHDAYGADRADMGDSLLGGLGPRSPEELAPFQALHGRKGLAKEDLHAKKESSSP